LAYFFGYGVGVTEAIGGDKTDTEAADEEMPSRVAADPPVAAVDRERLRGRSHGGGRHVRYYPLFKIQT
jgi:hypothetical protein